MVRSNRCYVCVSNFCFVSIYRIRTDHNMDDTGAVLETWCNAAQDIYLSVDCLSSDEIVYNLTHPYSETNEQYIHIAGLQQTALDAARESKADYFLVSFHHLFLKDHHCVRSLPY